MAEEIKITEQTPTPAPAAKTAAKTSTAPAAAAPVKAATPSKVKVILTGAGSFSGLGFRHILKGDELTVDSATATKLMALGLFKKV